MTINEIIEDNYEDLLSTCSCDKVVSQGRTECDILQDVCITAIRKFKKKDITEEEGLQYLKKTLQLEKKFQYNRIKSEKVVYTDQIEKYISGEEPADR